MTNIVLVPYYVPKVGKETLAYAYSNRPNTIYINIKAWRAAPAIKQSRIIHNLLSTFSHEEIHNVLTRIGHDAASYALDTLERDDAPYSLSGVTLPKRLAK